MSAARARMVLAAVLFAAWIGWLGYAVSQKGRVQILSRAQFAGAPVWVVAEVTVDGGGLPVGTVRVKETLRGQAPAVLSVRNLSSAVTPLPVTGDSRTPPAGDYLLALEPLSDGNYRIAGLPRSPGYEPQMPTRAVIYPWTDDVRRQLAGWR